MTLTFGGAATSPVEMGRRVGARLISMLLIGVLYFLMYGIPFLAFGSSNDPMSLITMGWVLGLIYGLGLFVWQMVAFFSKSTSVGGAVLKFHWVKVDTGQPAKGMVFVKYLVQSMFEGATMGIGAISYFVSYRDGQHWLDRAFGLTAIYDESAPAVSAPPRSDAVASSSPSPAQIMPVQMPQRPASAKSAPPSFASIQAQAPAPFSTPTAQAPQFRQPQPQAAPPAPQPPQVRQPQPPSPQVPVAPAANPFAPNNPWALPVEDGAPGVASPAVAPPAPVPPSFAPAGQPPLSPVHSTSMTRAEASSLLSDETVIDADLVEQHPLVIFDDGKEERLDGPVAIGRNPSAPAGYPFARLVQVVDESMKLSKTHAVLLPQDGGVAVYDVGATNGVHVEVDGVKSRLSAGEVHRLEPGTVLHLGGRFLRVHR